MIQADRQKFIEIVLGFAELKSKQLSAPALELYWRAMQRWSLEDFRAAAEQLVLTCEFMPTPKDFEDLRKAGRQTAGEAWAMVLEYVRKGYHRWHGGGLPTLNTEVQKPLSNLLDRAVAAIGGYQAIAMSEIDKTHFLERRFAEHFEAMQEADDIREAVPQIACENHGRLSAPLPIRNIVSLLAKSKAV
jgi:hypothetical protein